MSDLELQLASINSETPKEPIKKRGPGRPRKKKKEPEVDITVDDPIIETPPPPSEHVSFDDDPDAGFTEFIPIGEDTHNKQTLVGTILDLRKKLNAVGTGMVPSVYQTAEALQAEIDILNEEINARRGSMAGEAILNMVAPTIERVVLLVSAFIAPQFDFRGTAEEIKNNTEIFNECIQQITINNRTSTGPYLGIAQGIGECAFSAHMKNVKAAEETPAPNSE